MDLHSELQIIGARIDAALDRRLPPEHTFPQRLHRAMRYAVLDGGKRIRPALMYATARALDVPWDAIDGLAAAVELVHDYSLIHDDLPAMDDDALRRGRPTCHRAFDEAIAILAGDAIQALAFYVLAHDTTISADPATRLRLIEILGQAAGSRGMAGGQAMDLASVGKSLTLAELEDMHIHKTGLLIRSTVLMAAHLQPGLGETERDRLDHFAKCIGLAFQIQDDILDVEGHTDTLGKPQGSDQAQGKPTYPSIVGMEESKARALALHDEALRSLEFLDERADLLRALASYIVSRPK